jgi:hypothetical protein
MSDIRRNGLRKFVVGAVLSLVAVLFLIGLYQSLAGVGRIYMILPTIIVFPFIWAVIGFVEMTTGITFGQIAEKVESSGIWHVFLIVLGVAFFGWLIWLASLD